MSAVPQFTQIRGTDFGGSITYTPPVGGLPNLIGATITSQVKDAAGCRHDIPMTLDGAGLVMTYAVDKYDTAKWAPGLAYWDLRADYGTGLGIGTYKVAFTVAEPVTTPPEA